MDVLRPSAVNGLLILIAGLLSIRWLRDAVEVSRTRVVRMAPNSNEEAERSFLDLLREAQNEIVMTTTEIRTRNPCIRAKRSSRRSRTKSRKLPVPGGLRVERPQGSDPVRERTRWGVGRAHSPAA